MSGFEARAFRGCGVVTSEPFEVSDDNESLQMLTRSSQVGEFYVMAPPQIKPKGDGNHTCDIMIFDEERDCHIRVTWEDALKATLVEDDEFMTDRAKATTMQDGAENTTSLGTWAEKAEAWSKYNQGGEWSDDLDKDVRIVVARPFIECVPARSAPAARCLSHPADASCAGT